MYAQRNTIWRYRGVGARHATPEPCSGKEPYRSMAQRTILVADDDASIRSLLKQLLADEGHSVLEAATGTEVVEQVKGSSPDLVIMDVRMPELDGIEALQKVKIASPNTAVLIMTAF